MLQVQKKQPSFAKTVSILAIGICLLMAASVVVANIGYYLAAVSFSPWVTSTLFALLVSDAGLYLAGMPLLFLVGMFLPSDPMPLAPKRVLSLQDFAKLGCIGYTVMYFSNLITLAVVALVNVAMGLDPFYNPVAQTMGSIAPAARFLLVAILPAIGEEVIFRGFFYKKLARFGPAAYIFVSAFFFSTFHATINQMLYAFALGCVFAWIVWYTKTLAYSMLLHFIINFYSSSVIMEMGEGPLMSLLGLLTTVVVGFGIVFLSRIRRKLWVEKGRNMPKHPVLAAVLNPGMLTWLVVLTGVIVLTYI